MSAPTEEELAASIAPGEVWEGCVGGNRTLLRVVVTAVRTGVVEGEVVDPKSPGQPWPGRWPIDDFLRVYSPTGDCTCGPEEHRRRAQEFREDERERLVTALREAREERDRLLAAMTLVAQACGNADPATAHHAARRLAADRERAEVALLVERGRVAEMEFLRPEVRAFARAMEAKLRANDHKGGWKEDGPNALFLRLVEETEELRVALRDAKVNSRFPTAEEKARLLGEAADIANFAMMVVDVRSCLDAVAALAGGALEGKP